MVLAPSECLLCSRLKIPELVHVNAKCSARLHLALAVFATKMKLVSDSSADFRLLL